MSSIGQKNFSSIKDTFTKQHFSTNKINTYVQTEHSKLQKVLCYKSVSDWAEILGGKTRHCLPLAPEMSDQSDTFTITD